MQCQWCGSCCKEEALGFNHNEKPPREIPFCEEHWDELNMLLEELGERESCANGE